MKTAAGIPSAVRICADCGELASGETCAVCADLRRDACEWAKSLVDSDALSLTFRFVGGEGPATMVWCQAAEAEFHRLRAARLHSSLPSHRVEPPPAPRAVGLTVISAVALIVALYVCFGDLSWAM